MKLRIKIDRERRLYVIPSNLRKNYGHSCLGFDYAFEKGTATAQWLRDQGGGVEFPKPANIGTNRGYREYEVTIASARQHFEKTKQRCPVELSSQLLGLEGTRVEVVDMYGQKRRFYVGKSTGWIPCHLEIARIDSTGGPRVTGEPFQSVRVISNTDRCY